MNLEKIRHSLAHILAMAVLELEPKAKLGAGPAIEDGFYYDFSNIEKPNLEKIEKKMQEIIKKDIKFIKKEISKKEAEKLFKNQPYKLELIKELDKIIIYKSGDFTDLCSGPHIKSSKEINSKSFKLDRVAGAYWRGDEKNKMLTRIYGFAFKDEKELKKYLKTREQAKKRDHRKIGKNLGLFVFSDLIGSGLPVYTAKGAIIRQEIINYSRELRKELGYQEVHSPQINKAELFKISGHYDKYKQDMFRVISNYSEEEFYLKPMNCPQHCEVFKYQLRSYKDLPIRIADFANLYRDEKPGELSGLTRLRAFSQDDGHCFCKEDQIEKEFRDLLKVIKKALKYYGLSYYIRLSLRDKKNKKQYIGNDKSWDKAEKILEKLVKKLNYKKAPGEAAFYGPKLDIIAKDCLNREWQLSTIQLDFSMPKRFGLGYVDIKGRRQMPIMIHSALIGSPERFMAILLEHYNGALPFWLSPEQIWILPISKKHIDYANKVAKKLKDFRVKIIDSNQTLNKKIREGETKKIPYLLIAGDKEAVDETITLRPRARAGEQATIPAKKLSAYLRRK